MHNLVDFFPTYLSWEGDDLLTDQLCQTLMATCSSRLARALRRLAIGDPSRAEVLRNRVERLPDDALIRVLMAPETGYRLGYRSADDLDETMRYLEDAISVEDVRSGSASAAERPCWSALGDMHLAPKSVDTYIAPRVDGIVVDFQSPWALGKLPHIAGDAEPINDADRAVALARISAAAELLDATPGRAAYATRTFTQVIVVRSDKSRPDFYTSASSTLCMGRAVLRNPFVAAAAFTEVADGLVHEAIHCICDLIEIHDGRWLIGDADVYHVKVASPWTERQLDIHTYLQASWVWFGLWHFWAQAIESESVEVTEGLRLLERAYRGFADGAAIERLVPHRTLVAPGVFDALAEGQAALSAKMKHWERDLRGAVNRAAPTPVPQPLV